MADEKAAAGNRIKGIAAARHIGVGVAIEAQVAIQHLQTTGDLRAWQVAQSRRIAGNGGRALGPGCGAGVGQASVIGADLVEHDTTGPDLLTAQGQ